MDTSGKDKIEAKKPSYKQRIADITDDQINKAFTLRSHGTTVPVIADATGLQASTLYFWFRSPPKQLVQRILNTSTLKYLIDGNKQLLAAVTAERNFQDSEIGNQERMSTPVIDRRGTGTGYGSQYEIAAEMKKITEVNEKSPVLVSSDTSDNKLTFQSQVITEERLEETTSEVSTGQIQPFEIRSKNMLELNNKLVAYKVVLETHIGEVDRLISGLESLAYIETLENAEVEYQGRIKDLESEIERLKQAEKSL